MLPGSLKPIAFKAVDLERWKEQKQQKQQQRKLHGDEAALAAGLGSLKTICTMLDHLDFWSFHLEIGFISQFHS